MFLTIKSTASINNVVQLLVVVFLFVFVLVLAYLATRITGRIQMGNIRKNNIRVIETYRISNNNFIQIIEIGEKYFLISVTKERIEMLTQLDKEDLKLESLEEKMNYSFKKGNKNFKEIIDELIKKNKK